MSTYDAGPRYSMDTPGFFRVRVIGLPSQSWVTSMVGEVAIACEREDELVRTTLVVELADQASLIGFVNALYNTGHAILSVERVDPVEGPPATEPKDEP